MAKSNGIKHTIINSNGNNLTPSVQFGVYAENENEVEAEAFIQYWTDREVPVFVRPKMTWIGTLPEHYSTTDPRYLCSWQMDSLPIYYDGRLPFCICDWDSRLPQGHISKQGITEVWQTNYRRWQNLNLSGKFNELPDFCRECRDWQTKSIKGAAKEMFEKKQCFDDIEMVKPGYLKTKDTF